MNQTDLAFVADALLALCEAEARAPFYTESTFERKLVKARQKEPLFAKLAPKAGDDALLESECRQVFRAASLTARQTEVLTLRLEGHTFEEIGARNRRTKQSAMNVFVQALKKIRRSFDVYPYAGLSEVYKREIRRGTPLRRFGTMHR